MSVVLSDLSFSFPDGRAVLSGVNASFGSGRTGLIGVNGGGKSTLLRLVAGRLRPSRGAVAVSGAIGYLPQDLTLDVEATVAGLLGIAAVRAALRAVEAGSVDQSVFDAVGDDWDVEDRAREWLARLGLAHVGLDDPVRRLSGGETVLTALTALFLRRPAVLLLDEPTNNLDADARRRLYAAVAAWPGVMLIVSHDRALLALVDQVTELSAGSLHRYGGNLEAYEAQRATDQAAAQRAVTGLTEPVPGDPPPGDPAPGGMPVRSLAPDDAPAATFVSAVLAAGTVTLCWLGDSRAYWLAASEPPAGEGGSRQLTRDDSLAEEMVAAGMLAEADVLSAPQAHVVTRWVGADLRGAAPHLARFTPSGPGAVLLCSDGLWNYQPEAAQLARLALPGALTDPLGAAAGLVSFALDAGGHDNITAVLMPSPPAWPSDPGHQDLPTSASA